MLLHKILRVNVEVEDVENPNENTTRANIMDFIRGAIERYFDEFSEDLRLISGEKYFPGFEARSEVSY